MLIEKPVGAQRSAKVYDTQISGLQLNDPNPRHWDVGDEFKRMLSTSNFLTTEESLNFGLVVFIATLLSRFHASGFAANAVLAPLTAPQFC